MRYQSNHRDQPPGLFSLHFQRLTTSINMSKERSDPAGNWGGKSNNAGTPVSVMVRDLDETLEERYKEDDLPPLQPHCGSGPTNTGNSRGRPAATTYAVWVQSQKEKTGQPVEEGHPSPFATYSRIGSHQYRVVGYVNCPNPLLAQWPTGFLSELSKPSAGTMAYGVPV